ncbi:erythromycin esterase family protein [Flavobacterium sp. RHBU_3]|uniref:erythromycin esterase family protein n=1 Tax=Flavobacterium sp. RHBU_3 TaxID=3391184 RepID=UPI003984E9FD
MKKLLFSIAAFCSLLLHAQNQPVVEWINTNAIVIEDATPTTPPAAFAANVPKKFKDARVFGFGEASHHGKEFFDLKAKFFKYLVENQGVTLFIMEESYQAEEGINRWISGGEGDINTIKDNFRLIIWHNKEVVELLQWMRNYNAGKPREKQVRFYGMDNQMGDSLNTKLRNYVKKHNISIDENLLTAADSCAAAKLKAGGLKGWGDKMHPQLQQVRKVLESKSGRLSAAGSEEYYDTMRALNYLEEYTLFVTAPYSQSRDRDMYNNVVEILQHEGPNSKAFVWAHNAHIDKKSYGHYSSLSVGARLKEHFADAYYAVGFDFGAGILPGLVIKDKKANGWKNYDFKTPYKGTHAEVLVQAQPDVFFVDMDTANTNKDAAKFFNKKLKQLFLGGPGYNPDEPFFMKVKFAEHYDGIIFVKNILPATYDFSF